MRDDSESARKLGNVKMKTLERMGADPPPILADLVQEKEEKQQKLESLKKEKAEKDEIVSAEKEKVSAAKSELEKARNDSFKAEATLAEAKENAPQPDALKNDLEVAKRQYKAAEDMMKAKELEKKKGVFGGWF